MFLWLMLVNSVAVFRLDTVIFSALDLFDGNRLPAKTGCNPP